MRTDVVNEGRASPGKPRLVRGPDAPNSQVREIDLEVAGLEPLVINVFGATSLVAKSGTPSVINTFIVKDASDATINVAQLNTDEQALIIPLDINAKTISIERDDPAPHRLTLLLY